MGLMVPIVLIFDSVLRICAINWKQHWEIFDLVPFQESRQPGIVEQKRKWGWVAHGLSALRYLGECSTSSKLMLDARYRYLKYQHKYKYLNGAKNWSKKAGGEGRGGYRGRELTKVHHHH